MGIVDQLLDALFPPAAGDGVAGARPLAPPGRAVPPHLARLAEREAHMEALGITRGLFHLAAREAGEPVGSAALVDHRRGMFYDLSYVPGPKHFRVREVNGKLRELVTPRGVDAVMLRAWAMLAEPRVEPALLPHVHGFRKGRGPHSAARALAGAPLPPGSGLVRADVRRMFPSLRRSYLDEAVFERLACAPGAAATERFLGRPVDPLGHRLLGVLERWLDAWALPGGLPQGLCVSPMLSNLYLAREVDPWIAGALGSGLLVAGVRYADDFALVSPRPEAALDGLRAVLARAHLQLHPEKTDVVPCDGAWP